MRHNWLHKAKALVLWLVCSSFSQADRLLTRWSNSKSQGIAARRLDNRALREDSGEVVKYVVEKENMGFWSPVLVCSMRPAYFRKFLYWLERDCTLGRFGTPYDRVRVRRERDEVVATWVFDGNHARPL